MYSVAQNKRNSDSGTKIPYLGIFRMIFEKRIVIIEISTVKVAQKLKNVKFGQKIPFVGIFGMQFCPGYV